MERLIDKGIIAACCLTALISLSTDAFTFGGFLVALAISALDESLPRAWRLVTGAGYAVAAVVWPSLAAFLPLIAYDWVRDESWFVRVAWAIPLAAAMRAWETHLWATVVLFCIVAAALARRTMSLSAERDHFRKLRDDAHEASMSLEARNRDLQEARDLTAQVATLAERGRIAREIHDSVGHLLTRAIMQVEAFKVVHAAEPAVVAEYNTVSQTLDEAMRTVRASVHDLRDEAVDPRALMQSALDGCGLERANLVFEVDELPDDVAHCFVAIVREAATNTVRHSDATSIDVQVREYPGLFQLVVQDNGSGVTTNALAGAGMGLQTMDDRVRALDGTLRAGQLDGQGFRVFASVPKK